MTSAWLDRNAVEARLPDLEPIMFSLLQYDPDNGVYCLNKTPFSGVAITRWPDGSLQSLAHLQDGLSHGVSLAWYVGGQPRLYNEMAGDVIHGLHLKWNADGSIQEQYHALRGQRIRSTP